MYLLYCYENVNKRIMAPYMRSYDLRMSLFKPNNYIGSSVNLDYVSQGSSKGHSCYLYLYNKIVIDGYSNL